tara:strand:- start:1124 stop:1498 length:375 start_codon:yes stop_codon:yes gene_type:complete
MKEFKRVLKVGGVLEIDVPNVSSFRSVSRLIRGKNITYDYKKHYLYPEVIHTNGIPYFPHRHNREFAKRELELLYSEVGFKDIDVRYLKSVRHRTGFDKIRKIGTVIRDLIPLYRKTLIGFAVK